METVSYQRMLAELRSNFNERLPSGLNPKADHRLQRTITHWTNELTRVKGTVTEREILSKSYDSMVSWFKRNPYALVTTTPDIEAAVAPDMANQGLAAIGKRAFEGEVDDPLALFTAPSSSSQLAGSTPLLPQPKDFLQRDESVVKYVEVEHNLFLNSKDRNWLQDVGQNRYNFTVVLNAGGRAHGTAAQPSIMNRFRNIVRLEFVKAILPIEALTLVLPKDCSTESFPTAPSDGFCSVLGMPYVTVVCDEHEGNNYGTSDVIDKSLAVCQYDAMWRSNMLHTADNIGRGYTLYFPKLMKAQRIYAPAPLASFQQLTFQILSPENHILSKSRDSFSISAFILSTTVPPENCYYDVSGQYIYIQLSQYFPLWAFSQFDRVMFAGQQGTTPAANEFAQWLQNEEGHTVLGVAYGNAPDKIVTGWTNDGYANCIIIQNRFTPPDIGGAVTVDYFTGSAAGDESMFLDFSNFGKLLNLNRQVQLSLRVVCREKDPTTNLRPDNI